MFGASAMLGFGQGFQPVCGFNYGAKLYHRVKEGFWFCVKGSSIFLLGIGLLGIWLAPNLIGMFRDDPDVIRIGATALRFQCATFCFHSWIVVSNMMMQSIGRTLPATFLSVSRQGLFFIPAVLILSSVLGLLGIQMAQMAADIATMIFAIPMQIHILKTLERPE